ncbi:MAG: DinB family protein [Cellvibrionaceae bacterium]|nr:DinB family protein [Cellvibrionaceae bacterium]
MHSKIDDNHVRNTIIQGNIEALVQVQTLLCKLDDKQYGKIASDYTESSIGQHTRHILDIYDAVFLGAAAADALIDYDVRRRGSRIEFNLAVATASIEQVIRQLHLLLEVSSWPCLSVSTEVLLSSKESVRVVSNLERELVFAGSHAVHHLAFMGMIAKIVGIALPDPVGVGPSTASFLRDKSVKDSP